ncbi:helix-turn-helix domain-containing protein [Actinoplanes aureus]|uniref:Helix-turn-helix transcriptional regulator n=1 Tax=Actinoplanes aureus TaxID=2792083 RepID=A0A931CDP7_9ACTN|nr:helix-turn-helix domain-containing protein [Actinoplanes aureus]MBG0566734.1 helix-turn-helix transcriptional regulator [Actinoplanes aureus]
MLRLWLEPADLTRIRFADRLHPAGTVLLASQALRQPFVAACLPTLARRVAESAPALRPLHHLLPSQGFVPDFVTPLEGLTSIEDGLEAIRSTPAKRIRAEVSAAYAHTPVSAARRRFASADPLVLGALVDAMRSYFHRVLAPDWPALNRTHRQVVSEAASRYALSGAEGVLTGLHQAIRWRAPVLEVDAWQAGEVRLGGHGLILVPSPFAGPRPRVLVAPDRPALVVYPVEPATVPDSRRTTPDPLAGLLGRTRTAVLIHAAGPGRHTTSSIARQVGISVSSSSEHLAALRAAGLVSSRRDGGAVVHQATALSRDLVSADCGGQGSSTGHADSAVRARAVPPIRPVPALPRDRAAARRPSATAGNR